MMASFRVTAVIVSCQLRELLKVYTVERKLAWHDGMKKDIVGVWVG